MTAPTHPTWSDGSPILIGDRGTFSGVDEEFGQPWEHANVTVFGITWTSDGDTGFVKYSEWDILIEVEDGEHFELPFVSAVEPWGDKAVKS